MNEVTDPALLAQLNARQEVTDPTILAQLNGTTSASPGALTYGDRFKRGALDIGQGVKQRMMQANEAIFGPTANTDASVTQYPDTWSAQPPQAKVTPIQGQSAQDYTTGVNQQLQDYGSRLDAQGGGIKVPYLGKVDFPRLAGSAVATTPAMLLGPSGATVGARALAGMLQGGATGLAQFDPTNTGKAVLKNTLLGGASGAVLNPVVGAVGDKTASMVSQLADRLKGFDKPTPTVSDMQDLPGFSSLDTTDQGHVLQNAQGQMAKVGQMDQESLGRETNLRVNGVIPTKAMVTRNPGDWASERNLAKTLQQSPNPVLRAKGDQLVAAYTHNDQALGNGLKGLSTDLPPGTPETFGQTAMNVVNDIQKDTQAGVGRLYKQIRDTVGDNVGARPNAILDTINELSTSPAADPIVDATYRWMVKKGILTKAEDGSYQPDGTMSITQAEALRQHINSQPNSFGKAQLIRGVDKDVLDTAGADQFGTARAAAKARFDALDNPAVQRVLNTYGELQQGRAAQGFIQQHVLSAPVQDINALVGTVRQFGTAEQQKTFNDALQAGVMKHLEHRSINQTTGQFSGTALDKGVQEIGTQRLLAFMDPGRMQKLNSLRQAAVDATVQPAHSAVNSSNSGAMLLGMGHPSLAGAGIRAYLPDIAHEVLPQAIVNAPQNFAAKHAVDEVLKARSFPPGRPPNAMVLKLARMLGVGGAAALANQAAQPQNPAP